MCNLVLKFVLIVTFSSLVKCGSPGTSICVGGYMHPDKDMEAMMTTKCLPNVAVLDELNNAKSEEEVLKIVAKFYAPQFKCIFTQMQAVDDKGKLIPDKAQKFIEGIPKKGHAGAKKKLDDCIAKGNKVLKKETNSKTWEPFSDCLLHLLECTTTCAK